MQRVLDDSHLLLAFQQGDPSAERAIFDRFFEPLTLFSERITHDLAASEDIAVEALEKAIDRRTQFAVLPKLKGFLYQVVHNASINHVTSDARHRSIHEKVGYLERDQPGLDEVRETEILRAEILQEIYREVDNLPDRCGQIFKLIFIEGLDTEKIAERMGINVQTVRTQKARAISLIRTALLKKGRLATLLFFYAWLRLHS